MLHADNVADAANLFYSSTLGLLDTFFPETSSTITSRDPPYITPLIKRLLRQKNSLMRKGKIEKAGSLAVKIGAEIISFNSGRLKAENKDTSPQDLWRAVRDITGKNRSAPLYTCVDAASLNVHYASVSTDLAYTSPAPKLTCHNNIPWPTEFSVFQF